MRELKIGSSSVRGVVGDDLTPELIVDFACAFGTVCMLSSVCMSAPCPNFSVKASDATQASVSERPAAVIARSALCEAPSALPSASASA